MTDFWVESGFRLLDKNSDDHLAVTDDFLRAYFMRPEMEPVDESCNAERALHARLMENPRIEVSAADIQVMKDDDIKENYQILIGFRDRLLAAGTVENCYLSLFKADFSRIPPLFIKQLTQIILRNILDKTLYPLWARCGEMLFRDQKISVQDSAVMAADANIVELHLSNQAPANLEVVKGTSTAGQKTIELDVLSDANAEIYWDRSDNFDTVLDLRVWSQANEALCRVMEKWVDHFYRSPVQIQPLEQISDDKWVWHIGLDAEATSLLNDMYNGVDVAAERSQRLISLFRMEFRDKSLMRPYIAGRPIYLGLAMTADNILRIKPQNLLINLPLAENG